MTILRTIRPVLLAAASISLCASASSVAPSPTDRLERVVIVMRHGVRAAMSSPDALSQWNGRRWPAFAVPPGHLTAKGGRLVTLLGRYYRDHYRAAGLLGSADCSVYYWANLTQRTHATAAALAEGLTPECGAIVHQAARGPDPLFDAPLTPLAPPDPRALQAAMAGRIGNDLPTWNVRQHANLARFEALLLGCQGDCTEADRSRAPQRLDRVPILWDRDKDGAPLPTSPALQVAGLAESLMMGYADGHDFAALGWGFDAEDLTEAMIVHGAGIDLRLRTPEVGRQASSHLAYRLLATIGAGTELRVPTTKIGGTEKIIVLSGHDSTLNMLAGLLGIEWLVPSYAVGQAGPGGGLIFERWRRGGDGTRIVRVRYVVQGLDQLREERALSLEMPPESAAVMLPGCKVGHTGDCDLPSFAAMIRARADVRYAGIPFRLN